MKSKMVVILLCALMFATVFVVEVPANASTQVTEEWVARYDGPGNGPGDAGYDIAIDSSGNVYVSGWSFDNETHFDFVTIKYDSHGNQLWMVRYDNPKNGIDEGTLIALAPSGNVYVTGRSYYDGQTTYNYNTVAYDQNGNELWMANYDGPANGWETPRDIVTDSSGNVYITGASEGKGGAWQDYATIAYDPSGNELWVARYNGPGNEWDQAWALATDLSGNVYVTGESWGDGTGLEPWDYATIAYDPFGNELWVARYDGPGSEADGAKDIAIDASGNIYVTGWSYGNGTDFDYATIKYDSSGNEVWVARYNGPANGGDMAMAITIAPSGTIYVTGMSYGNGTDHDAADYATVAYDSSGNELWVARYDGLISGYDKAYDIALDSSGNVYVTGSSATNKGGLFPWWPWTISDYATVAYDSLGNELWVARYNGPGNGDDVAPAMAVDSFGNVYVTGWSHSTESYDYCTIKYSWTSPNQPPEARAGLDQIVYEGDVVNFDGSLSYDPDGTIETYEWDFDVRDGLWWETGGAPDAVGSTTTHTYGDDGVFTVTLRVSDNQRASAIDTCNITVLNVDPNVNIKSVTMDVKIGLRVAGRKYNKVDITLYEDGTPVGHATIKRLPGSPNTQMIWIPVTLDMTKSYTATVIYTPESRYNIGANPVWLYTKFEDGRTKKLHHTFNVQQSKKRDSNHWNHVEPWKVDLNSYLIGHQLEVTSHIKDPGSDDETLTYTYGSQVVTITYLNDPPNPDPYPSPEVKPIDIMDTTTLVYEGPGTVTLVVKDDDNIKLGVGQGSNSITLV
jgi:hypothetical protein